jgi:hypothetical protein
VENDGIYDGTERHAHCASTFRTIVLAGQEYPLSPPLSLSTVGMDFPFSIGGDVQFHLSKNGNILFYESN